MPPAVAVKNVGLGPCREEAFGDMLEAMMARIALRSQWLNWFTTKFYSTQGSFFGQDSKLLSKV
jgi:hypothetical protein